MLIKTTTGHIDKELLRNLLSTHHLACLLLSSFILQPFEPTLHHITCAATLPHRIGHPFPHICNKYMQPFFSDNSQHPKSQCCTKATDARTIHNQANHHPDVLHHTLPQSTVARRLQKALQQKTHNLSLATFSHACAIQSAYLLRPNVPPCGIHISIWSACMPQMHTFSFQ